MLDDDFFDTNTMENVGVTQVWMRYLELVMLSKMTIIARV